MQKRSKRQLAYRLNLLFSDTWRPEIIDLQLCVRSTAFKMKRFTKYLTERQEEVNGSIELLNHFHKFDKTA